MKFTFFSRNPRYEFHVFFKIFVFNFILRNSKTKLIFTQLIIGEYPIKITFDITQIYAMKQSGIVKIR